MWKEGVANMRVADAVGGASSNLRGAKCSSIIEPFKFISANESTAILILFYKDREEEFVKLAELWRRAVYDCCVD